MSRAYLKQNVYDAAIERLDFAFAYFAEEYFHG
jgi:predicted phosphoadenosine phosphosulfate sulfurtransferase